MVIILLFHTGVFFEVIACHWRELDGFYQLDQQLNEATYEFFRLKNTLEPRIQPVTAGSRSKNANHCAMRTPTGAFCL